MQCQKKDERNIKTFQKRKGFKRKETVKQGRAEQKKQNDAKENACGEEMIYLQKDWHEQVARQSARRKWRTYLRSVVTFGSFHKLDSRCSFSLSFGVHTD